MKRPVYIKGDNILTSLGFTSQDVMEMATAGVSGIKTSNDPALAPVSVPLSLVDTGMLYESFNRILFDLHPNKAEQFTRLEKMFIVSINEAITRSGLDINGNRTLLVLSSTKGNIDLLEEGKKKLYNPERVFLWKMADFIGSFFGFSNRPVVISNACISGVLALSYAARLIEESIYDTIVIAGGDMLSEFIISGFLSFQALSNDPCKPFDASRNGLSLGEGCGTIILSAFPGESSSIVISGSSSSNDANHISGPSRTGEELALAIRKSMSEAEIKPEEISFVSAHGTATLYNDEMESKALALSGLTNAPVNSFKGYWGHTLGAAGVIESVATIHSMRENLLIRSAGYAESGVPVKLNVISSNLSVPVKNCLKIASGFGGCNAAIIFRKVG